jgi:hypothetical protein
MNCNLKLIAYFCAIERNTMKSTLSIIVIAAALQGCAAVPAAVIGASVADRAAASTNTVPSGPSAVTVTKYQFFPSAAEMATLCKEKLLEQNPGADLTNMKIDHSRNMLLGVSTCVASL